MKKCLYIIAVIFLCSSCATTLKLGNGEKLKLEGVTGHNDLHTNTVWIESKPVYFTKYIFGTGKTNVGKIKLYFGLNVKNGNYNGITPIHIVNTYYGKNWIFFNKINFLVGNREQIQSFNGKSFNIYDDTSVPLKLSQTALTC